MNIGVNGIFGEDKAAEYMKKQGFSVVERNYRCRLGEIDIIAENRDYIVFAEVKLRKNADFAEAREFVDHRKQQRIIKTASYFLSVNDTDKQPRFDVIEVYAPRGILGSVKINHIENAFM